MDSRRQRWKEAKERKWKKGQVPTWGARVNRWLAADDRHDFYVPSRDGGTTVYTLRNGSVVVARSHTLYNGENK